MAGLEELDDLEHFIETEEHQTEIVEEQLEAAEARIESIREAIDELGGDDEVAQSIESRNLEDANQDLERVQQRKDELVSSVRSTISEIDQMASENEATNRVLNELNRLNEDVTDASSIVDRRRKSLERDAQKAQELLERLEGNS